MRPLLGLIGIAMVVLTMAACSSDSDSDSSPGVASPAPPPPASAETVGSAADALGAPTTGDDSSGGNAGDADRSVDVENQDPNGSGAYRFSPNELTFAVGETVQFNITAETEFHTFTVDELDIDVVVDAEQTETLVFKFDEAGTYRLYCIPHEAQGMVATITVQ